MSILKVRKFTKAGILGARTLLAKIRANNQLYTEEINRLILDKDFTKSIDETIWIDTEKTFETKLDLIAYFSPLFPPQLLHKYKTDAGLWTWLAMAYHHLFLKRVKNILTCAKDGRWIYDPEAYRDSRKHYIAGPLYLSDDFKLDEEGNETFFSESPQIFGPFIDAITLAPRFARIPAMRQIAVWLYHSPNTKNKLKRGAATQGKPGTIRELTRIVDHFDMTYDIFDTEDAKQFWNMLPKQFTKFKGNVEH